MAFGSLHFRSKLSNLSTFWITVDSPLTTTPAQPAIPAPSQEEVNERLRKQREWMEKDEQALGMIQLRLSHTLYSLCGLTSYRTWRNLEDQFGKPGAVMIFADFRALTAFRLTGGNPAPEISKMMTLLEHLHANRVNFNGFIQSMILLNALPVRGQVMLGL